MDRLGKLNEYGKNLKAVPDMERTLIDMFSNLGCLFQKTTDGFKLHWYDKDIFFRRFSELADLLVEDTHYCQQYLVKMEDFIQYGYGIDVDGGYGPASPSEWVEFIDAHGDFKAEWEHEYKVMDILANHADDIDLFDLYHAYKADCYDKKRKKRDDLG